MNAKANLLKSASFSLNVIHQGSAKLQHAIWQDDRGEWEPYFPNHFIYAFFAFNSLYNIDWSESYNKGRIVPIAKRPINSNGHIIMVEQTEGYKQDRYLSFCFKDRQFVSLYKDFFIRCVLKNHSKEEIKGFLSQIQLDKLPNGAIHTERFVNKFRMAIDDLLFGERFNKETIEIILDYIYKVRCNIFHGVKSISEMKKYRQQDRLIIYASFVIALNQMVFSYMDYLNQGESFKESFDNLYKGLM